MALFEVQQEETDLEAERRKDLAAGGDGVVIVHGRDPDADDEDEDDEQDDGETA